MRLALNILPIALCCMLSACGDNIPVIQVDDPQAKIKENMINANKVINQSEDTQLDEYISRHGWTMTKLDNGARIQILEPGSGAKIDYEDSVTVSYRLEALNGTVFYEDNTETFVLGRHQTTVGLDRALMGLNRGAHVRIALPSSLGYGVVGDGDRVPARAVLIYDLNVMK